MKKLYEKTIRDLEKEAELFLDNDEKVIGALTFAKIQRKWAIAMVKECCPEKTPLSLGAEDDYCEACNRLIWMFELTEEDLNGNK